MAQTASLAQPNHAHAPTDDSETGRDRLFVRVPEGLDASAIAELVRSAGGQDHAVGMHLHIVRDDRRLASLEGSIAFFAPGLRVISVPAWDTVPYDRVGPSSEIVARRMTALSKLVLDKRKQPTLVIATLNAVLQKVPPRAFIKNALKQMAPGQRIDLNRLTRRLALAGYSRTGTVMEPGEFAVRGGILDLFPPGRSSPVRLDFFGDTLETIKSFDPETQRTKKPVQKVVLLPTSEIAFGDEAVARFRSQYVELFGGGTIDDPLYEAISAGQRHPGEEHWLPLFHDKLETLFDYIGGDSVSFDARCEQALKQRFDQIGEHFEARKEALEIENFGAPPYKPVPPSQMFIDGPLWGELLSVLDVTRLSSEPPPENRADGADLRDFKARRGRNFTPERQNPEVDLFDAVVGHIRALQGQGKRVLVAAWSVGARERLATLLSDHGLSDCVRKVDNFDEARAQPGNVVALGTLGLEEGFETPDQAVICEQDILGDRLIRKKRRKRKAADVLSEATSLSVGDLVVHADHGIGQFAGLKTIEALGTRHDCLELTYANGDKLFLPVENIELLSRYGGDDGGSAIDKLGGVGWQNRKARLKKRLREMAAELIKIAAQRQVREAPALAPPLGAYDEFSARFPFEETEDQEASIEAVLDDLGQGRPMDRLVCGDVGFGKTEVAIRAAFVAALNGLQVAVVVPTTLLARQHFKTFKERFSGLPVKVAQASRLVPTKELNAVKEGLKSGDIDIVVGTHALLGKSISFAHLGLLIIDEEQHFGVSHKERLKSMREDVHVLTLSATPIPRTLQLALTGVRELSLITTPPVDRLAVRTSITPFDPVILRDALRRERFRGGQAFYVVPRISDLEDVREFLREAVPELRVAQAHGQLAPTELEDIMTAFYEGEYDILLSTPIVESGLDVPNANTMIVHRADMFGLAQLYQLRGRVGRGKTRAYSYFTTPPGKAVTEAAEKRLKVLQSLDSLGAGFSLASHDLDLRGAGNLLGEEQSGHIKEVGFELYQAMLEEAVAAMKGGDDAEAAEKWTPEISLGTSILIPESYVTDLQSRLGLYRRLSGLEQRADIDAFAEELVDRFGEMPEEVRHLLDVMEIKGLCRRAGITRVDAGPKGAVITFLDDRFANPEALMAVMAKSKGGMKLQRDHKLVARGDWDLPEKRLVGVRDVMATLAKAAEQGAPQQQPAN